MEKSTKSETEYYLVNKIGSGAYGIVYKVHDAEGKEFVLKRVDIKALTDEERNETLYEAELMMRLEAHEHLVRFHESFCDREGLNIVMEYYEGGDLAQVIKAKQNQKTYFSEQDIWRVLVQIGSALHHLHGHRILHRDIKPSNIFIDKNGNFKLGDLGLSRLLSSQSHFANTCVGTPLFYSPELCKGAMYDERSDIWAFGCLLYQMATLKPPFMATNQLALAQKIVMDDFDPLPGHYSSDLRFIIETMLEKSVSKRPDTNQILACHPVRSWIINSRERQLLQEHLAREKEMQSTIDKLKSRLKKAEDEVQTLRHSELEAQKTIKGLKEQVWKWMVKANEGNSQAPPPTAAATTTKANSLYKKSQLQLHRQSFMLGMASKFDDDEPRTDNDDENDNNNKKNKTKKKKRGHTKPTKPLTPIVQVRKQLVGIDDDQFYPDQKHLFRRRSATITSRKRYDMRSSVSSSEEFASIISSAASIMDKENLPQTPPPPPNVKNNPEPKKTIRPLKTITRNQNYETEQQDRRKEKLKKKAATSVKVARNLNFDLSCCLSSDEKNSSAGTTGTMRNNSSGISSPLKSLNSALGPARRVPTSLSAE